MQRSTKAKQNPIMKYFAMTILTVLLVSIEIYAQLKKEPYRFSADIENKIQQDTLPWKYQIGAAEFSISGHFRKALDAWDKNGSGIPKLSSEDSLYFKSFYPQPAADYIISRCGNEQVIIINEAHHNPMHRAFTESLLQGLYSKGYRFLGLEALFDSVINKRRFATTESGYYTQEPQMANLIREAIRIGFTVFGYEASQGKNGKEREIEQAKNIAVVMSKNPDSKFLIHCGYDHVIEGTPPTKSWEKAMAGRLKEYTGINPFTIDQVKYSEKGDPKFNHPYIKLAESEFPSVMVNLKGQLFNGKKDNDQIDCAIIHPTTKYLHGKPDWLSISGLRREFVIPDSLINQLPVLIFAYRKNEFGNNGIPADIAEIESKGQSVPLLLEKGEYKIIMKNKEYNTVSEFDHKIE